MRVLVTWGSKLGGTAGIGRIVAEELEQHGHDVEAMPVRDVAHLDRYDAAVIGGALYANRWHHEARRFVADHATALRKIPVWLFSSGPLDDTADRETLAPAPQVGVLADRIGAIEHVTFGGRLEPTARGFPASAMAKKLSGDWRNPDRIAAWADDVARRLPEARPRPASDPPARAAWRVLVHGVTGWAACAAVMAGLLAITSTGTALAVHAIAAPLIFIGIAVHYFRPHGARDPWPVALSFAAIVFVLDVVVVGGLVLHDFGMFRSFVGTWLPFGTILLVSYLVGLAMSMIPFPKRPSMDTKKAASSAA